MNALTKILNGADSSSVLEADLSKIYLIGKDLPPVPQDLPEPQLSDNAWYIGRTRYAFRNKQTGEPIETARQMFWRIAYNIATADRLYAKDNPAEAHIKTARKFYNMMARQQYIANTPTMLNAGKPNQQLSACFVIPVPDDLNSILKSASDMARIHKSGGGTGFSFGRLRPKDDMLSSSGGTSTGPVSFMQMYNDITSSVRQGGVRRGANMGMLPYNHPDVLLFAIYKVDEFSLTNFNISVSVTEEFFRQVEADAKHLPADYEEGFDFDTLVAEVREAHQTRDIDLKLVLLDKAVKKLRDWTEEADPSRGYELINPRTGKPAGRLNAKKVYDLITRLAWNYGDPGMIIIDRINNSRANPTPHLGQIEATNPCGEQPLLPYDACTLGSINLSKYVKDGEFDYENLRTAVHDATHFLDNVLDMNEYPIDEVRRMTRAIRRIGLGIMGFADALFEMGIGYNTPEGIKAAEDVMKFIQKESDNASEDLARVRGVFPAFEGSIYDKPGEIRPRNGARTTIAPTGTIAMLADCSSGCEPLFALTYAKNTIEGKRMFQTSPYFLAELKKRGLYSEGLLERIQENRGSIQGMDDLPEDLRRTYVVAGDISPEWHLKIQAAFQKFTDNAISKTINFSNSATVEDVREAYWLAYTTDCKGITIYRDGSRDKQILETKKSKSYYDKLAGKTGFGGTVASTEAQAGATTAPEAQATAPEAQASAPEAQLPAPEAQLPAPEALEGKTIQAPVALRQRPHVLNGRTYKTTTPSGTAYVSINEDEDGNIFEVFVNIGRAGSDILADAEAIGRLISLSFQIPSRYSAGKIAESIAQRLSGIGGSSSAGFGAQRVRSIADAIAKVIREHEAAKSGQPGTGELTPPAAPSISPLPPAAQAAGNPVTLPAAAAPKAAGNICPDCGLNTLRFIEGCEKCENCGFSKC